jgi:hypothetical protein
MFAPLDRHLALKNSCLKSKINIGMRLQQVFFYTYSVSTAAFSFLPLHRKKKVCEFPVPSRDVTTKLSLGGNNDVITEFIPAQGEFGTYVTSRLETGNS